MTASTPPVPALLLSQVRKGFARRLVLRGVDLAVAPGETVALFGANGAGKSTLLRVAATLLRPDGGAARVCGADAVMERSAARAALGFLGHAPMLQDALTARENLMLFARLDGLADARRRVNDLIARAGLASRATDPVRGFSRGMAQRLALARVCLKRPRLLLLDEPFTAVDRAGRDFLLALLAEARSGGAAVLLATHDVEAAWSAADRAVLLAGGRIVAGHARAERRLFEAALERAAEGAP
ncbi:MAG: heme ABC exporter ATP-binding protein CcmA [Planctomycetes bacterium]|nr:heme ABC exporter ATP-binding protein CcmA [Planctomycetota bacterium]